MAGVHPRVVRQLAESQRAECLADRLVEIGDSVAAAGVPGRPLGKSSLNRRATGSGTSCLRSAEVSRERCGSGLAWCSPSPMRRRRDGRVARDPGVPERVRGHDRFVDAQPIRAGVLIENLTDEDVITRNQAGSIDLPQLAEPRRVSWPTLIMIIGSLIGGWALIGVLIDVAGSFDTVIGADWLWVIMAFVLAQLAYVASAVESLGSVAGPLPLGRMKKLPSSTGMLATLAQKHNAWLMVDDAHGIAPVVQRPVQAARGDQRQQRPHHRRRS